MSTPPRGEGHRGQRRRDREGPMTTRTNAARRLRQQGQTARFSPVRLRGETATQGRQTAAGTGASHSSWRSAQHRASGPVVTDRRPARPLGCAGRVTPARVRQNRHVGGVDSLWERAFSARDLAPTGLLGSSPACRGSSRGRAIGGCAVPGSMPAPDTSETLEADGLLLARVRGWWSGDNGGLGQARSRATAMPIPEVGRPGTGEFPRSSTGR